MNLLNITSKFPKLTLIIVLGITAFFGYQLKNLKIDSSIDSLLIKTDPDYQYYVKTKDWFGSDNVTSLVIKDPSLYTQKKLEILQNLVFEMEVWEEVEKVDSLFTSPHFENIEGTLQTVPLLNFIPETSEEIGKIKQRALRNPFFSKTLINESGSLMTINISLTPQSKDPKQNINFAKKLDKTIAKLKKDFDEVFQLGTPELTREIELGIFADQKLIIPISIFTIILLLFITMGSFTSAIFPVITGVLSVVWTFGQMALLDIPIQMLTMGIPVLLLVIGSTEDTHIISEYDEALHIKRGIKDHALKYLSQKISIPILLTTITTAVGFGTIILNDIQLLKEFGIACSVGMIYNFIITIAISPVLLKFFSSEKNNGDHSEDDPENFFDRTANRIFHFVQKHYKILLSITIFIMISGGVLSQFVITNNSSLDMLKESSAIKQNILKTDGEIGGIFTFYLTLDSPEGKNFKNHELAQLVFKIENLKKKYPEFISGQSYTSLLALIHREFNDGLEKNYDIPANTNLINQYFLFLSPDDLRNFLTLDYIKANVIFRHNISSTVKTLKIIEELDSAVAEILKGSGIKHRFTGRRFLTDKASKDIVESQVSSLFIISVCVFVIIYFLFFDLRIAFFSLVPNIFPILILFAIMGLFNIYLDVGTCNIAAVAIGIATDDTLHFLARFEQNLKIVFNKTEAIRDTIKQEFRPILCTSLSLSLGLAILGFSTFVPLIKFGTLLALCIAIAFLSDIIITPILMNFMDESRFISIVEIFRYRIPPFVIKSSRAFEDIDPKTARNIILNGNIIELEKSSLLRPETLENHICLLLQGQIQILKASNRRGEDNDAIQWRQYGPGEIISLNDIKLPLGNINTQALNHCKLLAINPKFMDKIKNNYPEVADQLDKNLAQFFG